MVKRCRNPGYMGVDLSAHHATSCGQNLGINLILMENQITKTKELKVYYCHVIEV